MYLLRITEVSPSYILGLISVTLLIYINPPLCITLLWWKLGSVHFENLFELCCYRNPRKKIFNLVIELKYSSVSYRTSRTLLQSFIRVRFCDSYYLCLLSQIYRVPQNYRLKVNGSEGHKNGANQILIMCMFFSTSGHLV